MSNVATQSISSSPQGMTFHCQSDQERIEAIDQAFDYRGDITLTLFNGTILEGYIFNRTARPPHPHIQMFLKGDEKQTIVPYSDIQSIAFSGKDTADGKSWQSWMDKKDAERQAEAERIKAENEKLGIL